MVIGAGLAGCKALYPRWVTGAIGGGLECEVHDGEAVTIRRGSGDEWSPLSLLNRAWAKWGGFVGGGRGMVTR